MASTGSKGSASFLSYRKYCCCLCTRSGLNDLFESESAILQEIRESASNEESLLGHHHRKKEKNRSYNLLHPSDDTASLERKRSYRLQLCGGIVWFIQYMLYSMLFSVYPLQLIDDYNMNLLLIGSEIVLYPFISLLLTPLFQQYTLFVKIGLTRCVILGLLIQGLLCIAFGFVYFFKPAPSVSYSMTFYVANTIIRVFSAIISVLIELSIIQIIVQLTPRRFLTKQQSMPLYAMLGIVSGSIFSGCLYLLGYVLTFCILGVFIIICTFIVFACIPSDQINNSSSKGPNASFLVAFKNINVFYSSIIVLHALISITYLLSILALHLNNIDADSFNLGNISGILHIAGYYMAFGVSFAILSFAASNCTYHNCGSLRTMLVGTFAMSIGLSFISRTSYVFSYEEQNQMRPLLTGLIILGISSAFTVTPYLLYLRNALYQSYRKYTTMVAFDVYRFVVFLAIIIGPSVAYSLYSVTTDIEFPFIILSFTSFVLSVIGFILFKCLRWEWMRFEHSHSLSAVNNATPIKYNHANKPIAQPAIYEIRYIPILQDDKSFCCCCPHIMCFCSLGALYDRRNQRYKRITSTLASKNQTKHKKKRKHREGHKKSRRSFDETTDTFQGLNGSAEKDDMPGPMITVRKRTSRQPTFERVSVGGVTGDNEYDNDGRTITRDSAPAPTPEEHRTSIILQAGSWNTLASTDAQQLVLPTTMIVSDGNDNNGAPDEQDKEESPLSREKSRKVIQTAAHRLRDRSRQSVQRLILEARSDLLRSVAMW